MNFILPESASVNSEFANTTNPRGLVHYLSRLILITTRVISTRINTIQTFMMNYKVNTFPDLEKSSILSCLFIPSRHFLHFCAGGHYFDASRHRQYLVSYFSMPVYCKYHKESFNTVLVLPHLPWFPIQRQ